MALSLFVMSNSTNIFVLVSAYYPFSDYTILPVLDFFYVTNSLENSCPSLCDMGQFNSFTIFLGSMTQDTQIEQNGTVISHTQKGISN